MSDKPFTILIVDNNDEESTSLLQRLAGDSVIVEAASGKEALAACQNQEVHLVLLALQMPLMDGLEFAEQLHKHTPGRHTPIIFITNEFNAVEFQQRGYAVGDVDYLTRPIDDNQILNRVRLYRQLFEHEQERRRNNSELERRVRERTLELEEKARQLADEVATRQESETRFRRFFDNNSSVMLLIEPHDGVVVDANRAAADYYGYSAAELSGMPISSINSLPEEKIAEERQRALTQSRNYFNFKHRLASGELRDVEVYSTPVEVEGSMMLFSIVHDITARKKAQEELKLAASVFSHASEGIVITDTVGTIVDVNDASLQISGYSREEVIGKNPSMFASGRQDPEVYADMWSELSESGHWSGEIWNRRKNGEVYAEMLTISAVHDADGKVKNYVGLFSDITEAKQHQHQLEHVAHYDALTNLPNRVLLADRLHQAMARAKRSGQQLAVAYIDLDGFKAVNDCHGHDIGDQLLMTVANRMQEVLRESDTISRLGGDEFVAVLADLSSHNDATVVLRRLLEAAAMPIHVNELILQVSASLGVTYYPQHDEVDADQLLRQADQAMYQAKLAGKNRFHIFDSELDRSVRGHHESLENIQTALVRDELVLYYQPKVNMRSGKVVGVEALIRWQHLEQGLLPPAAFLPVIEGHPLEVELGEWVIETALKQMAAWNRLGLEIPVSVNVGAQQLQQPDFTQRLQQRLAAYPEIKPGQLELEVLETSALEDIVQVSEVMRSCHEMGISFALDDFGTGYSSLTYIKRLPAATLKIDRSFVRDMLDDPDDLAILEGVLGLAAAFRRKVIAEGVETVEHGQLLLKLGCELAQGYGISRPIPAEAIPEWAASWRPDPSWAEQPKISRDDLPLLFAGVEHRAWINAVEEKLRGHAAAPPPLDHHKCRFGEWLEGEGRQGHQEHPLFVAIEEKHREVHNLALALLQQNREEGMELLHQLRDELLELLHELLLGG